MVFLRLSKGKITIQSKVQDILEDIIVWLFALMTCAPLNAQAQTANAPRRFLRRRHKTHTSHIGMEEGGWRVAHGHGGHRCRLAFNTAIMTVHFLEMCIIWIQNLLNSKILRITRSARYNEIFHSVHNNSGGRNCATSINPGTNQPMGLLHLSLD